MGGSVCSRCEKQAPVNGASHGLCYVCARDVANMLADEILSGIEQLVRFLESHAEFDRWLVGHGLPKENE